MMPLTICLVGSQNVFSHLVTVEERRDRELSEVTGGDLVRHRKPATQPATVTAHRRSCPQPMPFHHLTILDIIMLSV